MRIVVHEEEVPEVQTADRVLLFRRACSQWLERLCPDDSHESVAPVCEGLHSTFH